MSTLAAPVQATAPAALLLSGLSKTFPGQQALAGVDLKVDPGEIHALLGANGSGKSTLIKVLSGYHRPDPGASVEIGGESLPFGNPMAAHKLGARFVHQDLGLIGSLSVADNLCLGDRFPTVAGTIRSGVQRRITRDLLKIVDLDVDPDTPVSSLSPAMQTGVAVARALRPSPDSQVRLLVLDEPTATLPDHEVHALLATIRAVAAQGIGIVYVTHRLDEIFEVCHNVTVLRDGRKTAERPVAGLTHDELVTLLVGGQPEKIDRAGSSVGDDESAVLSVTNLTTPQIRGASFMTVRGVVTGIAGITGSGRETVLGAIFGATTYEDGSVTVNDVPVKRNRPGASVRAGMAFVPANRKTEGALMNLSARENITLSDLRPFQRGLTLLRGRERKEARIWFEKLAVRPAEGAELPLSSFSGGNQQKVVMAKWMRRKPPLLLVEEPTQGVDIAAKAEIHRQIRQAASDGASVVASCSDPSELAELCDRVLVMRRGRIVAELTGSEISADRISRITVEDSRNS